MPRQIGDDQLARGRIRRWTPSAVVPHINRLRELRVAAERDSDIAHARLQEMVLDLRLAPGTFVNEQSLADELGLGRMPVREALARLAKDRFITIVPRRGILVTTMTLNDVLDMFEAREAIECGVAYIAATRATNEDLRTLRTLVGRGSLPTPNNSSKTTTRSTRFWST